MDLEPFGTVFVLVAKKNVHLHLSTGSGHSDSSRLRLRGNIGIDGEGRRRFELRTRLTTELTDSMRHVPRADAPELEHRGSVTRHLPRSNFAGPIYRFNRVGWSAASCVGPHQQGWREARIDPCTAYSEWTNLLRRYGCAARGG